MFSKINILRIIVDHLRTLRDDQRDKFYKGDLILFFVLPLVLAFLIVKYSSTALSDFSTELAASLSIFAALLFNLLLLIYTFFDRRSDKPSPVDTERKKLRKKIKLLQEIYANISFSIFVSLLAILAIIFAINTSGVYEMGFSFVVFAISLNFILTLIMVLKRVHVLLSDEFQGLNDKYVEKSEDKK